MYLDIGLGNDLLDVTPKTQATEAKLSKWNYIKLKSFCTAKETNIKMKRQPTEWEQIIANHISDTGLISKIHKELIQLNNRKTNNLILKMSRGSEQTFSQRHTGSQQAHGKMFNITNYQGNANQNHNEISSHTCQNGYY